MSHRYYFYVTQKSRKSQKDICHTEVDFISHRNHGNHRNIFMSHGNHGNHRNIFMSHRNHGNHRKIYVTQKPRKSQKDICHTEITEITEKYISARF